ncbi:MAG: hypothetical protein ACE5IA_03635 [Dehalococcoidia bacterium]
MPGDHVSANGLAGEAPENHATETRQERREKRGRKKKERMAQHGGGLRRVYRDAVLKRVKPKSS